MTKKHFTAIARIIKDNTVISADSIEEELAFETMRVAIAEELAYYFQRENSRFDRDRFLNACGVDKQYGD